MRDGGDYILPPVSDDPKAMSDKREQAINASRRAIDLYAAAEFARINERLKNVEAQGESNVKRTEEVYGEIFGGPHGQVGLSETLRNLIKKWGAVAAVGAFLAGTAPWIIDKVASMANKSLHPPITMEQDWKINGGKRLRAFNEQEQKWEYFYPETKETKR